MAVDKSVIHATYDAANARVRLSTDSRSAEWMTIWSACNEITDDIQSAGLLEASIPVWALFRLGTTLLHLRGEIRFSPDDRVTEILRGGQEARRDLTAAPVPPISAANLQSALTQAGFVRTITPEQTRNVAKLIRFSRGADFSVPGAGKTTEALAFYAVKRSEGDKVVVVAPPNAFAPWEEQLELCFGQNALRIERLVGGIQDIHNRLASNPDVALVSYHKMTQPAVRRAVSSYLSQHRSFVFLDESHKIKLGENGAWGNAVLSMAHLPAYKLVLSGTPLPNSEADLVAQMRFLHHEEDIDEENVKRLIQPIFVRTTKNELHLPDLKLRAVPVPLGPGQRQLYEALSMPIKSEIQIALGRRDRFAMRRLGKSVLKLIRFVSNPALLLTDVQYMENQQLRDVLLQEDSFKIEYAVSRARQLAGDDRKCIIWSSFVSNVEIIAGRLADLGAEYIHGSVNVGSEDDDTRERRIKQFHEDPHRFVLIANPAAAGEAISLHTVCQNAIYVDRNFNAAQFLQSMDRIHRIGSDNPVYVEVLTSPDTVDDAVNRRLVDKVNLMASVLKDPGLNIDTTYEDPSDDEDVAEADLKAILNGDEVDKFL